MPLFTEEVPLCESERFGYISDISILDARPKSENRPAESDNLYSQQDISEEFQEFIGLGCRYEDFTDEFNIAAGHDKQSSRLMTDESKIDDVGDDEECRPNSLPTFKMPKRYAFDKTDVANERDVFSKNEIDVERSMVKKSPTIERKKPKDYK